MEEITLKDLDPRLQKQIQTAEQSVTRGNANYAIEICSGMLVAKPGCVEIRKVLRAAQQHLAQSKSKGSKLLSGVTNAPFIMKATAAAAKDPLKGMEDAEKMLKVNPDNAAAHKLLGVAATAADFKKTAIFAYECIAKIEPANIDNWIALGEAYMADGQIKEAITAGDKVLSIQPGNGPASDLVRRASVSRSIDEGSWDQEGDFRDKVKDMDKTVKLEKAAAVMNDEDSLWNMINETYAKIQEQPEDINLYKDIAANYRKLGDHESAIGWIAHARTLPTGVADTALEALQSELYVEQTDLTIAGIKEQLAADPENAELIDAVAQWEAHLAQYKMDEAKMLVEKYPNDYNYRYELGMLLYEAGDLDDSIRELQLAQRNPKVRIKAMLYLGMALKSGKKYDLAKDQFLTLKDELQIMNDEKKNAIYELAESYELMGKRDEAMEEYKILYQHDISFRDVSDKINSFYE